VSAPRILIAEDDPELRETVLRGLREEGFDAFGAATAARLLELAEQHPPDGLVVDIGLPDADGRDLCQSLRARGVTAPVMFLTARDALPDRLSGFAAGGDDYLTKPFAFAELVARLQALLRRSPPAPAAGADIVVDPVTHSAHRGERSTRLTPTEYRLLALLVARTGEAVRRRELVQAGWPYGAIAHDNTLDVYTARLRRKLRELESTAELETVRGVGYLFR
jgi:two-component system, OmpR family, response regulator